MLARELSSLNRLPRVVRRQGFPVPGPVYVGLVVAGMNQCRRCATLCLADSGCHPGACRARRCRVEGMRQERTSVVCSLQNWDIL